MTRQGIVDADDKFSQGLKIEWRQWVGESNYGTAIKTVKSLV
jgi:hypothetical protein